MQELSALQETKSQGVVQFLRTLAEMQELTLKRLTTTVEEERSRQELLEYYKSREAEASKRRQQLEKDLNHIRRDCERAQSQRTEILTKLKADLLDVKDSKLQRMTELRQRYEGRMKDHQEQFDQRREDLEKKIAELRDKNQKRRVLSQDEEMSKKKLVKRYEMDVENVIKSYDSQVKDMAYNLNEHHEMQKKEQKLLSELREHFEKVDAENDFIKAEEGISNARLAKQQKESESRNASSALVQAYWRGIIQREQYVSMKKASKKGGKKGKKK
jgi:hypothetical protein